MSTTTAAPFGGVYSGKRVLVTGHTGFKGAWLSHWLLRLGAEVTGFSLAPPTTPSLFEQLGLGSRVRHILGDVRDFEALRQAVQSARPEFVFHLAAQSLVRYSYDEPVLTYATNVMGTAHVLEALRRMEAPCAVVAITTDKCYENREWVHAYREEDPLGGHDPYSSSKGAAEFVISSYRRSYFSDASSLIRLASARAGNVVGGGDWARDRIIPDCIRALQRAEAIPVRNRLATRPWQHVLEPLSGYLWLGAGMAEPRLVQTAPHNSVSVELSSVRMQLCSAFNFGPAQSSNRTVAELVNEIFKTWPGRSNDVSQSGDRHEARRLSLAIDKAYHLLHWEPVWDFTTTIAYTIEWYRQCTQGGASAGDLCLRQIEFYTAEACRRELRWAQSYE